MLTVLQEEFNLNAKQQPLTFHQSILIWEEIKDSRTFRTHSTVKQNKNYHIKVKRYLKLDLNLQLNNKYRTHLFSYLHLPHALHPSKLIIDKQ